jgi:hypothetical protein
MAVTFHFLYIESSTYANYLNIYLISLLQMKDSLTCKSIIVLMQEYYLKKVLKGGTDILEINLHPIVPI